MNVAARASAKSGAQATARQRAEIAAAVAALGERFAIAAAQLARVKIGFRVWTTQNSRLWGPLSFTDPWPDDRPATFIRTAAPPVEWGVYAYSELGSARRFAEAAHGTCVRGEVAVLGSVLLWEDIRILTGHRLLGRLFADEVVAGQGYPLELFALYRAGRRSRRVADARTLDALALRYGAAVRRPPAEASLAALYGSLLDYDRVPRRNEKAVRLAELERNAPARARGAAHLSRNDRTVSQAVARLGAVFGPPRAVPGGS